MPSAASFEAHGLHVVPVGVDQERGVVFRAVVLAQAGRAIVAAAGLQAGRVKAVDGGRVFRDERDMHAALGRGVVALAGFKAEGVHAPLTILGEGDRDYQARYEFTDHAGPITDLPYVTLTEGRERWAVIQSVSKSLGPDLRLTLGHGDSGGEQVQRWAPAARVVKAFNTTGFNIMDDPVLAGRHAVMFVAGDDAAAKAVALDLASSIGFEAVDSGALSQSRLLEPMAQLWIHCAYRQGLTRDYAFALARRGA